MASKTRDYVVTDTLTKVERLVEAISPGQAKQHCSSHLNAVAASASDVRRLMSAGVKPEKAGEHGDGDSDK